MQSAAAICTVRCGQDDGFACVRLLPSFKRCEITGASAGTQLDKGMSPTLAMRKISGAQTYVETGGNY